MSKQVLSAASRVWARAAALQAEEAVLSAPARIREEPVVFRPPPAVPRARPFAPPYKPPAARPRPTRAPAGPAHEQQEAREQDEMWSDPRRVVEAEVFDDPPTPTSASSLAGSQAPQATAKAGTDKRPPPSATVAALQRQADRIEADRASTPQTRVESRPDAAATVAAQQRQADRIEADLKPAKVEVKPEPKVDVKPPPPAEPKAEPKVEVKPEPTVEVKPEPKVEVKPEPKVEIKPEPTPERKPFVFDPNADPATYLPQVQAEPEDEPVVLRSSTVPTSRLGRLFHYGSLGASLAMGAAGETFRRSTGSGGTGSVFMSDSNVRRLVATLGRMRGAALKLGQFMSIQDNTILPPEIERVLHQVQAHANYMPDWQLDAVMKAELGAEWEAQFAAFDRTPVAAASIGQVHRATLKDGTHVAVKAQFPGVADSIGSDIANLSILLRGSALMPKGLYLQNTIAVMKRELEDECDYEREAMAGKKFAGLLKDDKVFAVPAVIDSCTSKRVLTTEWADGRPLSKLRNLTQEQRDLIGTNVLRLCLEELFKFRFMQTDPNWGNFLFRPASGQIQLIDFGASREYTPEFMEGWYKLLRAALDGDRGVMKAESESLGYLTGEEGPEMLGAHIASMQALASPFQQEGIFDFRQQTITDEVRKNIPIMLENRLTPPPAPTYSLNRKLSGAFLMCAKLGSRVNCKQLWDEATEDYSKMFAKA